MTLHTTLLRDVVEQRLVDRWPAFADRHPRLAEAIDRTRLIEAAVADLVDDPAFAAAMDAADLDEHALRQVLDLLQRVETVVGRIVPLAI
jgi:hypothetical protein